MIKAISESGPFELPGDIKGLSPKAKLTIMKALVKDPTDSATYPVYDHEISQAGRHVYHSKDSRKTLEVYQDDAGHTYVKEYDKVSTLFKADADWKILDRIKVDGQRDVFNNGSANEVEKSAWVINPSLSASITAYSSLNKELMVSNDDGSALAKQYIFDANKLKSEYSTQDLLDGKGLSVGYDLANASYKLSYVEEPRIGLNINNLDQIGFNQLEYGIEASAGAGFKLEIQKPSDILEFREKIKLGVNVGVAPVLGYETGNNNYGQGDYFNLFNEADRLQFQNIAIEHGLSGKIKSELDSIVPIGPDGLPDLYPYYKELSVPKITLEQKAALEQKLAQNHETLLTKYNIGRVSTPEAVAPQEVVQSIETGTGSEIATEADSYKEDTLPQDLLKGSNGTEPAYFTRQTGDVPVETPINDSATKTLPAEEARFSEVADVISSTEFQDLQNSGFTTVENLYQETQAILDTLPEEVPAPAMVQPGEEPFAVDPALATGEADLQTMPEDLELELLEEDTPLLAPEDELETLEQELGFLYPDEFLEEVEGDTSNALSNEAEVLEQKGFVGDEDDIALTEGEIDLHTLLKEAEAEENEPQAEASSAPDPEQEEETEDSLLQDLMDTGQEQEIDILSETELAEQQPEWQDQQADAKTRNTPEGVATLPDYVDEYAEEDLQTLLDAAVAEEDPGLTGEAAQEAVAPQENTEFLEEELSPTASMPQETEVHEELEENLLGERPEAREEAVYDETAYAAEPYEESADESSLKSVGGQEEEDNTAPGNSSSIRMQEAAVASSEAIQNVGEQDADALYGEQPQSDETDLETTDAEIESSFSDTESPLYDPMQAYDLEETEEAGNTGAATNQANLAAIQQDTLNSLIGEYETALENNLEEISTGDSYAESVSEIGSTSGAYDLEESALLGSRSTTDYSSAAYDSAGLTDAESYAAESSYTSSIAEASVVSDYSTSAYGTSEGSEDYGGVGENAANFGESYGIFSQPNESVFEPRGSMDSIESSSSSSYDAEISTSSSDSSSYDYEDSDSDSSSYQASSSSDSGSSSESSSSYDSYESSSDDSYEPSSSSYNSSSSYDYSSSYSSYDSYTSEGDNYAEEPMPEAESYDWSSATDSAEYDSLGEGGGMATDLLADELTRNSASAGSSGSGATVTPQ